jgi:thiamine pyrophosphokinase
MHHAIVVIGGDPPDPKVRPHLPSPAVVIAADGGLDHAIALGLTVDVVVGDLDSVSATALTAAEASGVVVERHPVAKDATDTELALDAARCRGAEAITIVSGGGDRLDHLLSTIALLGHPSLRDRRVDAWVGRAHLIRLRGPATAVIAGRAGELLSLLPIGGDAHGVTTTDLTYPLADEPLTVATSRGISNVLVGERASITVTTGSLLVILPEAIA